MHVLNQKPFESFPASNFYLLNISPCQRELLPGVRGQREAQHRHGGDQQTRHYQVVKVVHGSPPDLDGEGDVKIRLRAALIDHFVAGCWDTCNNPTLVNSHLINNGLAFSPILNE